MRKLKLITTLLFLATPFAANAALINPGDSGTFSWFGGLGSEVEIGTIALAEKAYIDFSVEDCCVIGDQFGLLVDGVLTAWTTESGGDISGTGPLFAAAITGLKLSAGLHTIGIVVTQDCCGSGGAFWSYDGATSVPEPGTLALLGIGLLGFGLSRRRIKA